ncbi:MAG: hydantoinase/oxoprolinase family protein [Thermoleophilia bacterium]|nr:hydantoinase/oxoprolinase family protein [Thermoleophilia bacterium]
MATRIGIDIGGTFTDLIYYDDETGRVEIAKTATTPGALERGVLQAVRIAVPPALVRSTRYFMHGTTIGLNALLTRSGASTGLLCTEGFRDVLEIGRGDRAVMYDIFWKRPMMLVPRRHRLTVRERIRADGEILTALLEEDVTVALATFADAGIESIAVCLMNAYVNPVHELEIERILRVHGFDGEISLSHRLSREYREYERSSTTVIDAYIRPATGRYLEGLLRGLAEIGFAGDVLVTRSGGGALSAAELAIRPFEAIQSGPVAGVEGAAELCRAHGWKLAITADVGGTSFDTALIVDGRPHVKHEGEIVGWPLQTSWVDVVSIGAGGGSIAYADGGLLRVGPRSAGAEPGPACYGRGGTEPTVTDAALVLGMFGDGTLSSDFRLDRDASERALKPLADELGMAVDEAARGVLTVAAAAMAEAIREITVGQGEDPRQAKVITFGGAGPLFGTMLATELGVPEIAVPPYAGNFSAWGLLGQDVTKEAAQTIFRVLSSSLIDDLNRILGEMFERTEHQEQPGSAPSERVVGLDLRYVGQEHTLTVERPAPDGQLLPEHIEAIKQSFAGEYERRFGTTLDEQLEVVTVRATARQSLPRKAHQHLFAGAATGVERPPTVRAYSFARRDWLEFAVLERASIESDRPVDGPAIVFEPTATTYLDAGFHAVLDASGALLITRIAAGGVA